MGKHGTGRIALIDDEDAALVGGHRWHMAHSYAAAYIRSISRSPTLMHRLIMGFPEGMVIDHINDNPLDNRRSNLRVVTNAQNTSRQRRRNKHGYRGIRQDNSLNTRGSNRGKFVAAISKTIDGVYRTFYLGHFSTPKEAALAYDVAAKKLYGEFARLNFPDD